MPVDKCNKGSLLFSEKTRISPKDVKDHNKAQWLLPWQIFNSKENYSQFIVDLHSIYSYKFYLEWNNKLKCIFLNFKILEIYSNWSKNSGTISTVWFLKWGCCVTDRISLVVFDLTSDRSFCKGVFRSRLRLWDFKRGLQRKQKANFKKKGERRITMMVSSLNIHQMELGMLQNFMKDFGRSQMKWGAVLCEKDSGSSLTFAVADRLFAFGRMASCEAGGSGFPFAVRIVRVNTSSKNTNEIHSPLSPLKHSLHSNLEYFTTRFPN